MTDSELQAVAILRAGGSYLEAATATGLSVEAVMALWRNAEDAAKQKAS